jgi:hypothetical protein
LSILSFTDSHGVAWRVWETLPGIGVVSVDGRLTGGWLTFDSQSERRRLVPIPRGWENAGAAALEAMCGDAERVRKSGPHSL